MPDHEDSSIVAILFHRPSQPLDPSDPGHLSSETGQRLFRLLSAITDDINAQPCPKKIESSMTPHIISVCFDMHGASLFDLRNNPLVLGFEEKHHVQIAFQPRSVYMQKKRLAVFDMDSTLIQQEVIDQLAKHAGFEDEVSAITARAMNGELDFSASLRERVKLLKGLPETIFEELKPSITLTPGADTLLRCLKKSGAKTALLSGGFVPLAEWIAGKLGIDHVHANELAVGEDGKLTGQLKDGCIIVDAARKRHLLKEIAELEDVHDKNDIIAVGDGANDLPMLWEAGLGVAVNAKPKVQKDAPARLNGKTALLDVLYLAGFTSDEIDELAE